MGPFSHRDKRSTMNDMIKAAFEDGDTHRKLGEAMANSLYAAANSEGPMRRVMRRMKEFDAMSPEDQGRRRKTLEVQGTSLPEGERYLNRLARARLRPDFEPIDMRWGLFQQFQDLGITNLRTAKEWGRAQYQTPEQWDRFAVFGTRDMSWQLSWWIEVLDGRYPDDVARGYGHDLYLNCRYGIEICDFIYGHGE